MFDIYSSSHHYLVIYHWHDEAPNEPVDFDGDVFGEFVRQFCKPHHHFPIVSQAFSPC